MTRDIVVLDTETTGLNNATDRVIEIGAIKLRGQRPISKFHTYINAQGVSSNPAALAVHGITEQFLLDKPIFSDIYNALLAFISDTDLVIHNAPFDVGFLDAELARVGYPAKVKDICCIVDTLVLAKQQFPGQKNSLDAFCKRFGIANDHRTLHGALLDADLLAKVYLQMSVNQSDFLAQAASGDKSQQSQQATDGASWQQPIALIKADEAACEAHNAWMQSMHEI